MMPNRLPIKYTVWGFLFLVVNSTLLGPAVQAEHKENLVFIMTFNRPMEERAAALKSASALSHAKREDFRGAAHDPWRAVSWRWWAESCLTPWHVSFWMLERGMQSPLSRDYRRPLLGRCVIFHHVFSRGSNVIISKYFCPRNSKDSYLGATFHFQRFCRSCKPWWMMSLFGPKTLGKATPKLLLTGWWRRNPLLGETSAAAWASPHHLTLDLQEHLVFFFPPCWCKIRTSHSAPYKLPQYQCPTQT